MPVKPGKRLVAAKRGKKGRNRLSPRFAGMILVVFFVAATSVLFVGGYRFITCCRYFAVTDIEVEGACVLSTEDVIRASGVSEGENILSVNLGLVRRRLLANPWIAGAEVYRTLPGRLKISILEHRPVAVVDMGERFYVGEDGRMFARFDSTGPDTLPLITGVDKRDIDDRGLPTGRGFKAALDLLAQRGFTARLLPELDVQSISVDRDAGLTLFTSGDIQGIRLGFSDYNDKLLRLGRVMPLLEKQRENGRRIVSVGLEWPGRVVVGTEASGIYADNSKKGESCGSKTL